MHSDRLPLSRLVSDARSNRHGLNNNSARFLRLTPAQIAADHQR